MLESLLSTLFADCIGNILKFLFEIIFKKDK